MARAAAVKPAAQKERHGLYLVRPPQGLSPQARELQGLLSGLSPEDFRKAVGVISVYATRGEVTDKEVEIWLREIEADGARKGRAHILEL